MIPQRIKTLFLFLLCLWGLAAGKVKALEENEYRFEHLWPQIPQPWYFFEPFDIAVDSKGRAWISDSKNHRIQIFDRNGGFVQTFGLWGDRVGNFKDPSFIALDSTDHAWIIDSGNSRIQKCDANGNCQNLIKTSPQLEILGLSGIAIDDQDRVWVLDNGQNKIHRFSNAGTYIDSLGKAGSQVGEFNNPIDIAMGSDGRVWIIDKGNHRLQILNQAGQFLPQLEYAYLNDPNGIFVTSGNSVLVTEGSTNQIQRFDVNGKLTGNFVGKNDELVSPWGMTELSDGNIWVASRYNNHVVIYTPQGQLVQSLGSSGYSQGMFDSPRGIQIDAKKRIWVVDSYNNRIQLFDQKGTVLSTWGDYTSLPEPEGIVLTPDGKAWISDLQKHQIQLFDEQGHILKTLGKKGAAQGEFDKPKGLAIDGKGRLWVVDSHNCRVQVFDNNGIFLFSFGRQGIGNGEFGLDSIGSSEADGPSGIAIDGQGNAWVADTQNARVQIFDENGHFLHAIHSDDLGESSLSFPYGMAADSNGQIWVVDHYEHSLKAFNASYQITRIIGSFGSSPGQFSGPLYAAVGANQEIFISDLFNQRIQKYGLRGKLNTVQHPYKAIILAGGGENIGNFTNHIWNGTWRITLKARQALSLQGFKSDELLFLTAGNTQMDLNQNGKLDDLYPATKKNLQDAITQWAVDAKDVIIYLADHGGPGKFQINGTEILTGEELNLWVNQLKQTLPKDGKVIVVIESCKSGGFIKQLAAPDRYLFASAKEDQAAIIANDGFNSFSYFFWGEINSGAKLRNAFSNARQAMSSSLIDGQPIDAQAEADGDQRFTAKDLDTLGDYCLGNCNTTAASPPVISPIKPSHITLNNQNSLEFSITVSSLEAIRNAWVLIHRPDDLTIDREQVVNIKSLPLTCQAMEQGRNVCRGRYDALDVMGQYGFSFFAMDANYQLSSPEQLSVSQPQGKLLYPVEFDANSNNLSLRDVEVGGGHLQAVLQLQEGHFILTAYQQANTILPQAAQFDVDTGVLTIPLVRAFGKDYSAKLNYAGGALFTLESVTPR